MNQFSELSYCAAMVAGQRIVLAKLKIRNGYKSSTELATDLIKHCIEQADTSIRYHPRYIALVSEMANKYQKMRLGELTKVIEESIAGYEKEFS